jgi:hypothetical protein
MKVLLHETRMMMRAGDLLYCRGTLGLAAALTAAEAAMLAPQYAPELANYRSNAPTNVDLWNNWVFTPSIRATGTSKAGNKVVVYAHVPHHYSNHANIRAAVAGKTLRQGAGPLPQTEFERLVALDGMIDDNDIRRVWVTDYDTLRRAPNGAIPIYKALEHPQTIPFLGDGTGAQAYLSAHTIAYNTKYIGIWHSDDFDEHTPRARLLCFGLDGSISLDGYGNLGSSGRFLGVPVAREQQSSCPCNFDRDLG